jgi:alpha-galactosidase
VAIGSGCARTLLLPGVRYDDAWHGAGLDGECTVDGKKATCPAGAAGSVALTLAGAVVKTSFTAAKDTVVQALSGEGPLTLAGARSWLSNGFQSWSQSGAIAIGAPPDDKELVKALSTRGDAEVLRDGTELGWTFTVAGGGGPSVLAGALSAKRFKPWTQVWRSDGGKLHLRIACGGTGEHVIVAAGDSIDGETFRVETGEDLPRMLSSYAAAIPSRRTGMKSPPPAEAGWNSWYELWNGVTEQDVRDNAPLAKKILAPQLPKGTKLRIVVDDGWEQAWGDWDPDKKRFPSGLDGLASDLTQQGFEMGVWLAPLIASEKSAVYTAHPGWFVGGAVYTPLGKAPMHVLDVTNPEAAAHLTATIQKIVGWGYSLLKIDYLFAGTWEGKRAQDVTGMQAYAMALDIIRKAAGDKTLLLAVGAPGLASLPYVDSWRAGGDIALETFGPSWPFVANEARSIGARAPLCLATLCDADPVLLRKLPENEVDVGGWVMAFGGGALFLSDDLTKLDASRQGWGLDAARVALALGGSPAVPVDYLPRGAPDHLQSAIGDQISAHGSTTNVVPTLWRLPDGSRVGLNVTDKSISAGGTSIPPRSAKAL